MNTDSPKPKHQHDFVATGMRRSWCRRCNQNAIWDPQAMEFIPEGNKLTCYQGTDERYWGYFGNPYTNDWEGK